MSSLATAESGSDTNAEALNPDVPLSQLEQFSGYELPPFLPGEAMGDADCSERNVDLDSRTIRGLAEELRSAKVSCCGKIHENASGDFTQPINGALPKFEYWNCEIRNLTHNLVCGHPGMLGRTFLTCTHILSHLGKIDDATVTRWENETKEIMSLLKQLDAEGRFEYQDQQGADKEKVRLETRKRLQRGEAEVGKRSAALRDEILEHYDTILVEQGAEPKESHGTTAEGHEWERIDNSLRPYRFRIESLIVDVRLPDQIDAVADTLGITAENLGSPVSKILEKHRSSLVASLMKKNLHGRPAFHECDVHITSA